MSPRHATHAGTPFPGRRVLIQGGTATVVAAALVAGPALASGAQAATVSPVAAASAAAAAPTLKVGSKGAAVTAVQQRLLRLGYWLPKADGTYGESTKHAVVALQKVAGLPRDGVLGPKTRAVLDRGVRPAAKTTKGYAVEIDLTRQVLIIVRNGTVAAVLDTSTGSGRKYQDSSGGTSTAVTPKGTFKVTRGVDGWRHAPLGDLWRPKYFNGGIAVHGYTSVPATAASHGCARVMMEAMNWIWQQGLMPVGMKVIVRA